MQFFKKKNPSFKTVKPKVSTGKKIGNRTVIGMVCILVAFAVCFGVAPLVNGVSDAQTEIVRVVQTVTKGSQITDGDVEVVRVGAYNLPSSVFKTKEDVVGKYATGDLYPGEYLLPANLTTDVGTAADILESLGGTQKALSLTIGSFAQGLSGKLQTGDIISVIVYSSKDAFAYTPPELQYVKVITSTTSTGVDKADVTDTTQPVTVTLLVNQEQAELLAQFEKTASMHFALEYRGEAETAQQYLNRQNEYFANQEG